MDWCWEISSPQLTFWIYYIFRKKHFVVLAPFKNNQTSQNCWKRLCRTPSGLCFSLAGQEIISFSARFDLHLISGQCLTHCYVRSRHTHIYYIWFVLFPPGEILHLTARPKSEWDWIWKWRVLQTSSFCWCCGTRQHGEQDIFLRETNTRAYRHFCASRHIKPDSCKLFG